MEQALQIKVTLKTRLKTLKDTQDFLLACLDLEGKKSKLIEIEKTTQEEGFFGSEESVKILQEKSYIEKIINQLELITDFTETSQEILDIIEDEQDPMITDIKNQLVDIEKTAEELRLQAMFSGEADGNDCYIEINAGAGGTDSQDFAQMLERMYIRYCDKQSYKFDIITRITGEEAGIKQIIAQVSGPNAYGMLKFETGVHRLVRISPFNANGKRQTSFASLLISPVVDDTINIKINDKDLKIDTFRASGAGGQHVNTTDSAVRITHIPTGIVTACQNQRSQHQNKATAMKMLKSKLHKIELDKQLAQKDAIEKTDIAWGNQIRNYILHPYKMVKDLRSKYETSKTDDILDGKLDELIFSCHEKFSGTK